MSGTPEAKRPPPLVTPEKRFRPYNKNAKPRPENGGEELGVDTGVKPTWSDQADV